MQAAGGTAIVVNTAPGRRSVRLLSLAYAIGVLGLIAEHTGQPLERVAEDSLRDRWYTAEQSVEYGFIDRVVSDVADIYPAALATRMGPGFAADLAEHRIARPGGRSGVLA